MKITRVLFQGRKAYTGWFKERFGDHVAQVSTDSTLKLKAAVRDIARMIHRRCPTCSTVFEEVDRCPRCSVETIGFIPDDVEMWCKKFEEPPMGQTDHNFVLGYESDDEGWVPGSIESDENLKAYIAAYPKDWEIVKQALGLARQKGRHACAFVIANKPIPSFIPMTTVSGEPCTQFTAKSVEGVGGLKMDFLNIKILAKIQGAMQLIQRRSADPSAFVPMQLKGRLVPAHRLVPIPGGGFADIWDLPEDQDVFRDVAEGKVETVFQFGTPGAIKWLEHFDYQRPDGKMAINSIEDMSAFTALDRPGALKMMVINPDWEGDPDDPQGQHNMLVEYARRSRGATPSPGVLKCLSDLVPETYGVMTYQEQLQRVYQVMTSCSLVDAEKFRIMVGKKEKEKIDQTYPYWMEKAGAKLGEEDAARLWEFIKTWAEYGFNKSHAICYAVTAYACAYLKHHYPLEWWCSVLTHTPKEKIAKELWRHCRHIVALPDVRLSGDVWVIEGDKVRAPTNLLTGVGPSAHEQLTKYAPYESILDFAQKIRAHQEATSGPKQRKKKGTDDEYETVTAPGHNALHRGIVHTLIVSGAMQSLFPAGYSTAECMADYESALKQAFGKGYKKPSKKTQYPILDTLGRYQARKAVLPVYGDDLRPVIKAVGLPSCLKLLDDGRRMRFVYRKWDRRRREEYTAEDPVIGGERLEALVNADDAPLGGWSCGVVAYVETAKNFQYPKSTKANTACKLTLEVEGGRFEFVYWPDKKSGKLPDHVAAVSAGDIVAALLVRWDQSDEFAIRELRVIRPAALKPAAEEKKPDEQPADDED